MHSRKTSICLFSSGWLALLGVASTVTAFGQQANGIVVGPQRPPVYGGLPVQKVGEGDLLGISSSDAPELSRAIRVGPDGAIRLPELGDKVPVKGLMPAEIESAITKALQDQKLYLQPDISVTVVEYQSHPISVVGAVKKPITFQASGDVSLLEALARAEGMTAEAGGEIVVTRSGTEETHHIPVKELLAGMSPELNLKLRGGEEVRIPEVGKVVVWGNVKKSGVYPVQGSGESSVMTVLAQAEGVLPFSTKLAYIYRPDEQGRRIEIPIELSRLMARKIPDIPLRAQDILYVPDNSGRRATAAAIDRITGFGSSTASGLIVWKK